MMLVIKITSNNYSKCPILHKSYTCQLHQLQVLVQLQVPIPIIPPNKSFTFTKYYFFGKLKCFNFTGIAVTVSCSFVVFTFNV